MFHNAMLIRIAFLCHSVLAHQYVHSSWIRRITSWVTSVSLNDANI
jgi:hypothetical protein